MKLSKQAVERTLAIVAEVTEKYKDKLFITVALDRDPETGMSMKDILLAVQKEAPEDKKQQIQVALDTGVYDQTEEIVNEEVAVAMNDEIDQRILEAVDKKQLPKLSATFLKKKTRKYVRKLKNNSTETQEE